MWKGEMEGWMEGWGGGPGTGEMEGWMDARPPHDIPSHPSSPVSTGMGDIEEREGSGEVWGAH